MQISFAALSCSNLAALSCSNLAALSCSNLAAHCCNLAACAFFVCKLDFSLLVAACLLQTVAACLLQTAAACLLQTAEACLLQLTASTRLHRFDICLLIKALIGGTAGPFFLSKMVLAGPFFWPIMFFFYQEIFRLT